MEKTIVLAAGCFWGTQEYFRRVPGVVKTRVGYAQGEMENPTYKEVKAQISGHAEVCEVTFEDSVVSLREILEHYIGIIDPTSLNHQGEDEGTSYRTGIYSFSEEDMNFSKQFLKEKQADYKLPLVVETALLDRFYDAEDYHQDYLQKNPTGYCHIDFSKLNQIKKTK